MDEVELSVIWRVFARISVRFELRDCSDFEAQGFWLLGADELWIKNAVLDFKMFSVQF